VQQGRVVLVDTNIIIEAIRVGCWAALTGYFRMETVAKCREEARTGRGYRPGYVTVTDEDLRERLAVHEVDDVELVELAVRDPRSSFLDAGEKHLWAHALRRTDGWSASTADAAAVHAAVRLGWEDRLVSLEEMVESCGSRTGGKLAKQFRAEQLRAWRTAAVLERGLK
jgi:hypothetical protein